MKSVVGLGVQPLCVTLLIMLSACGSGAGSGKSDVETGPGLDAIVDVAADLPIAADAVDAVDLLAELPPDTIPPLVKIVSPKDGAVVSGEHTIVVDASDDRSIAAVDVYLEGELLGTVTTEPWEVLWDTSALATGNYHLLAIATDLAGNTAQDDVQVQVQGSCDETGDCPPKSVKVITPVDGSTVCGTVTIEAAAQDDIGLAEVEFMVDGDSLGVDVDSPYQKDWKTTDSSKGEHFVKVIARDSSGQEAFATIAVLVDNSGGSCDNLPNVAIEQPVDSGYVYGTVDVMAKASDDIGVLKVQFFVDNALVSEDGTAPYKMGWDSDEFDEGAHTLKAIAYDTGDQMGTMQIQVTVDRTPPELEILSPDTEEPFQESLPVVATASDNFVVKQVELSVEYQTEPVVLTTSPYEMDLDLSTVSSGWQVLFASAADGAGHVTESWTDFLVDRPPTVAFVEPGEGETVFGQVVVTVEAMDDLDNPAVDFFVDGALVGEMYGVDGYEYVYYWETPYEKADYVLKVVARDDWEQTATAELEILVDHPVEAVLLVCEGTECDPLSDGTELTGVVKLKVEAEDDGADIEQVEFHVDGNLVKVVDNHPWEYQWDTEASGDGLHTVKIVAANTLAEKGEDSAEVLVNNCDLDHDTYLAATCDGSDCDDLNPDKNPGELDIVGNNQDENCDGIDGVDADGDGHASAASGGDDCNDSSVDITVCGCGEECMGSECKFTACAARECGPDTCGGSCGSCSENEVCSATGICECPSGIGCMGGCCGEEQVCGSSGKCCTPDCGAVDCGTDGCGFSCGTCGPKEICAEGICVCQAECAGKECGTNGCGGSCGTCGLDKECDGQGQCVNGLLWKPIPGGTFTMGCSPADGDCDSDEKPPHSVTLSPFEMLETEVTKGQYAAVAGDTPSCDDGGGGGADWPVACIDWYEAKAFCEEVGARLCTEAEWEYAARGGTTTKYYCGDSANCLIGIAWYGSDPDEPRHEVKGKTPNAYGLYDMLGNVGEWTADWYSSTYYSISPANSPTGPNSGSFRVTRGGWYGGADVLRVSLRGDVPPSVGGSGLGGRCCRSECVSSCSGKECGDDGCGGVCGQCDADENCSAGECIALVDFECKGLNTPSLEVCDLVDHYEGCCDTLGRVIWCDDGQLFCIDCVDGGNPSCGWQGEFYDCGTDGGEDPNGTFPHGCGYTVGCEPPCAEAEICVGGVCDVCTPDCKGALCGPDGCGGMCGNCGIGELCNEESGQCYPHPCGDVPEEGKCTGNNLLLECVNNELVETSCPGLGDNFYCKWDGPTQKYVCAKGCVPNCKFPDETPKECGYDGCYGLCGICTEGWGCEAGSCYPAAGAACGWVTESGICMEAILWFCNGGKLHVDDCDASGMSCVFDQGTGKFKCQ